MSKLTTENLEKLDVKQTPRRMSVLQRDMEGMTTGPNIRRMSRMVEPRPSVQYGASRRMSYVSRSSISGASFPGRGALMAPIRLQNSYRLGPDPSEKFNAGQAEKVIKNVLESYLEGEKYDNKLCNNLVQNLSEVIKGRMKDMGYSPRYKFICVVTAGENKGQSLAATSRSVWNTDTDNYASASYSKGDLFAVATVFATYFE